MNGSEHIIMTARLSSAPRLLPRKRARQSNFERFRKVLELQPRFQVRLGRLAKRHTSHGDKHQQKKVDILLALDLTKLTVENQIQRAVLITADSDFVPVIQVARDASKVVELCYCPNLRYNNELAQACDDRIIIDQAFIGKAKA